MISVFDMAELSPEDKAQLDLVIKGASVFLGLEQEAGRDTSEVNRQEDNFTAWIVGLSAGAIAGIIAIPKFAAISRWEALLVFAFFILSILSGVSYRWILKELVTADRRASYNKRSSLIAIILFSPGVTSTDGVKEAKARLKEVMEKTDPQYVELIATTDRWFKWAKRMQYATLLTFFLGVLAATAVVTIRWEPAKNPPQAPPQQVPRIQQSGS
jgi:hypothetical protein